MPHTCPVHEVEELDAVVVDAAGDGRRKCEYVEAEDKGGLEESNDAVWINDIGNLAVK